MTQAGPHTQPRHTTADRLEMCGGCPNWTAGLNDYAALLNTRIERQGSGPGRVPSHWKAI